MVAKIKLNAASGGGSVSLQAPSSSSNNRVITLPDIADGTLLTNQSTISGTITMAEQWELSDEVTVSSAQTYHLTGTWAKRNQNGAGTIGTSGMSVSSGIFTFPSTGIYKVDFFGVQRNSFGTGRRRVQSQIHTTHDNSTYIYAAQGGTNLSNRGSTTSCSDTVSIIFDVQDTSNYKVTFKINFSNEGRINARSSDTTATNVIFLRLGDT